MAGIDYGMGTTNIDKENSIRYGVIPQNEVLQVWCDSSEAYYGEPEEGICTYCDKTTSIPKDCKWGDTIKCEHCDEEFEIELPDCCDPISHFIDDDEYKAECGDSGDIFITKSPYYTKCNFCSPCAPGAGYLMNANDDGVKTYCFSHDFFDAQQAPYPVYRVSDNSLVNPE